MWWVSSMPPLVRAHTPLPGYEGHGASPCLLCPTVLAGAQFCQPAPAAPLAHHREVIWHAACLPQVCHAAPNRSRSSVMLSHYNIAARVAWHEGVCVCVGVGVGGGGGLRCFLHYLAHHITAGRTKDAYSLVPCTNPSKSSENQVCVAQAAHEFSGSGAAGWAPYRAS